jgi:hypothetical protein
LTPVGIGCGRGWSLRQRARRCFNIIVVRAPALGEIPISIPAQTSTYWRGPGMLRCLVFNPAALIIAACLIGPSASRAQQSDPLGSLDRFYVPVPAPSIDPTPRTFVMNGQRYNIPRNFIESLENDNDGSPAAVSMRVLLPDIVGLSRESMPCLNYQTVCSDNVVTIGLLRGEHAVAGSQILENIRPLILPDKFVGPCGLDFYENAGHESGRFQYFFKKTNQDTNFSILICPKEGSSFLPNCRSNNDIGDGNHVYYIFNRKHICEWEGIRDKILARIASFKGG